MTITVPQVTGHPVSDVTVISLDRHDQSEALQVPDRERPHDTGTAALAIAGSEDGDGPTPVSGELFRLVALRAPLAATGSLPRIDLAPIPAGAESGNTGVDKTGVLGDFVAYEGPDNRLLPAQSLSLSLAAVQDCMAPADITAWVQTTTGASLGWFVGTPEWSSYRSDTHTQLQLRLLPDNAAQFTNPRQAAGYLRLTRIIALLDGIGRVNPTILDSATVQRLMTRAQVILSADAFRTPMDRLSRPPMVADLKVVRLGQPSYELGGIAHIENVMASETRSRKHRITYESETTTTDSDVRTTEQERDLQTTSQVQLTQEATKAIQQASSINAGLTITASYGPTVSATLDTRLARSQSQNESTRTAANYANQITQQARRKVVEQVTKTVVSRHLLRTQETNLHSFNNVGSEAKNINGVYRHVEQVQDAWIENYGKRLMLEYLVPDPGAMVRWAEESSALAYNAGPEPAPPADPNDAAKPLDPSLIVPENYLKIVARAGALSVPPPPEPSIDIAVSFKGDPKDELILFQDNTTLKVPTGYQAQIWVAQAVLWGRSNQPDDAWMVGVGEDAVPRTVGGPELQRKVSGQILAAADSVIPVVMLGRGFINFAASVRVTCMVTDVHRQAWQLEVYNRVMDAYNQRHETWTSAVARATADNDAVAAAFPVDSSVNQAVERRELRRLVIESLIGTPEDAGQFAGSAVTYPKPDRPEVHQDVLALERDSILFFEQAFEWENLTWLHYPYYWADGNLWREAITRPPGDDPAWTAFLSAGASRVLAPVRPGFEQAMTLYLTTGIIWAGGSVPTVGDPSYLGIAEELAESLGAEAPPAELTPLDQVRLPTDLIYLQESPGLEP